MGAAAKGDFAARVLSLKQLDRIIVSKRHAVNRDVKIAVEMNIVALRQETWRAARRAATPSYPGGKVMRAIVLAMAIGLAGIAPALSSTNTVTGPQVKSGQQQAFPYLYVCPGSVYVNLGGVGGGGGHIRISVEFPSIIPCAV